MDMYLQMLDTIHNFNRYMIDRERDIHSNVIMCTLHHVLGSWILNATDQEG